MLSCVAARFTELNLLRPADLSTGRDTNSHCGFGEVECPGWTKSH